MAKLTDTQLVVLSAASNREAGSILPLPKSIKGGAATKVVDGLIRRGLAERIISDRPAVPDLVRITRAGLEALGIEPEDAPPAEAARSARTRHRRRSPTAKHADDNRQPRAGTKQALLVDMLRRPRGVTIDEIVEATGWQRHTVRGAFAGALKKKLGLAIASEKVEGRGRVYKIA